MEALQEESNSRTIRAAQVGLGIRDQGVPHPSLELRLLPWALSSLLVVHLGEPGAAASLLWHPKCLAKVI